MARYSALSFLAPLAWSTYSRPSENPPGVTHEIRASVSAAWRAKGSAFPDGGEAVLEALITELASIEDPRCEWKGERRLLDILVIAVCAVLGEAESFEDIALYGRCKEAWLRGFLALPNGIPSHDTFRRVLMLVDPDAFERSFLAWVRAVFRPEEGALRQVAIDGKAVR